MTTKHRRPRMKQLFEGEHADLAARLNGMVEAGQLVVIFQPHAAQTEFAFQAVATGDGQTGIIGIAKVAGL